MCDPNKVENNAGATRIRNNYNRDAIFREDQTDLLHVFQQHHYDLLTENPPSRNPDFVPSYGQLFAGRSTASATVSPSASSSVEFDAIIHHRCSSGTDTNTMASNNPFDETSGPTDPANRNLFETFGGGAERSHRASQSRPISATCTPSYGAGAGATGSPPFHLAAAIAVSDIDGSAIPFVAALRISDDDERESQRARRNPDASGFAEEPDMVEATSVHPVCRPPPLVFFSEASRVSPNVLFLAEGRIEERHSSRGSAASASSAAAASDGYTWIASGSDSGRPLPSSYFAEEERRMNGGGFVYRNTNPFGNDSGNPKKTTTTRGGTGSGNRTSWSRISVKARAAAGEAKRSLKKKLSKESQKIVGSTKLMAKEQKVAIKALLPRRRW